MEFEWDEAKNKANLAKHGIDFSDATAVFEGVVVFYEDDRFDYGERRERATGTIADGTVVVVVFTRRDSKVRLISARPASRFERKEYEKALH
jgi:uncharacterized protein